MNMFIPSPVRSVLDTLQAAGFQAYLAGGCVRDALLGKVPHDYDIATSALPEEVEQLFGKTVPTGKKHGTMTVISEKTPVEVTTFRTESGYRDHRRPDHVHFVGDLKEDLARRDFTINAMAYSPSQGLIDLYGGQEDLKNGIIRAVGDPGERFEEDALRMFRAFRFAARLGFAIEKETLRAIGEKENLSEFLAAERVRPEIEEVLKTDPERIEQMTGLLRPWIPELGQMAKMEQNSPYHYTDVLHHTLDALKAANSQDPVVLWALLLHDTGKIKCHQFYDGHDHFKKHEIESAKIAQRVCGDLKMDKTSAKEIVRLVKDHDCFYAPRPSNLYKLFGKKGYKDSLLEKLFVVQYGDIMAHTTHDRLKSLNDFKSWYEKNRNVLPLSIRDLEISGTDVLENTPLKGPQIAKALDWVWAQALNVPSRRNRKGQLELLKQAALMIEQESGQ